jgi:hypothetical protein
LDSPLDAFSSESSADAPPRHPTPLPLEPRPAWRRARRTTLVNRVRRKLIDAIDRVADITATVFAFLRAPRSWTTTAPWHRWPIRRPAWATNERLAVIVAAALTSAAVAQFTLWMGNDSTTRGAEASAPMSAEMPAPLRRAESPVALELAADRVSPPRASTTTPAPAVPAVQSPPAVASLPGIFAEDHGVSQAAMSPHDRPVLMDARIAAGTTGLAPPHTVPVASLASGRDHPAAARGYRQNGGENSRQNRVVPRPAAVPAGLVVITRPEGARVTINGVGWGMTPLTIGHLPPGAKRVRITMPGYRSEERVVATDPERPAATLRITLREVAEERPPH